MTDLNKTQLNFVKKANDILDNADATLDAAKQDKAQRQADFMRLCAKTSSAMAAEKFAAACDAFDNKTRRSLAKSYGHATVAPLMESIITTAQAEVADRQAAKEAGKDINGFLQDASYVNIANKMVTRIKNEKDFAHITTPDGAIGSLRGESVQKRAAAETPDGVKAKMKKSLNNATIKGMFTTESLNAVAAAIDALEVKPAEPEKPETSEDDLNLEDALAQTAEGEADSELGELLAGLQQSQIQQGKVLAALAQRLG